MRLSKEEFCNAVNTYQKMFEKTEEIEHILNIDPDNVFSEFSNNFYEFLSSMCELEADDKVGDWLSYYCFEMDFGKKYEDGDIVIGGKNVPLRNVEDLWHILELEASIRIRGNSTNL